MTKGITSYRSILSISAPLMLASAAQNIIALTDSVFLYHLSESDFASIGFISVFYLVIAAIGYGFSRGGQIIIARRAGEGNNNAIGCTFYAILYFELALSVVMFLFLQFITPHFFTWFIDSPIVYEKSLEYLQYRSWGVFFSYAGVSIIALYMGVAKTTFIIIDTVILAIVNIVLDYGLIFGQWGLPEMGISGAGLASTIAEVAAFVVFVIYMMFDHSAKRYKVFKPRRVDIELIKTQYRLALPMVLQAFVSIGSWSVFFSIIENLGERELAISNLGRMVYLVFSIPTWGLSTGINTLTSNMIGRKKRQAVLPLTWRTAKLSFGLTMLIIIPFLIFPQHILYPFLGNSNVELINSALPVFYVIALNLAIFSIGSIYFSSLSSTGATLYGLKIQVISAVFYVAYIYIAINVLNAGLLWAWASEFFYWLLMLVLVFNYLRSRKWHLLKV